MKRTQNFGNKIFLPSNEICGNAYYAGPSKPILQCSMLFVVLTNKNGGVAVPETNGFINQLKTCFGPDRSSSGDS
jgi:hypothetical protein